jgi:rhodanese-related sulfurtransferase
MACHGAARRAAKAGYLNVFIMAAGTDGWVKAGKKLEKG